MLRTNTHPLSRQLTLSFGLLIAAIACGFCAVTFYGSWQNQRAALGEASRHASVFIAGAVAQTLAAGGTNDLGASRAELASSTLISATCVYDTATRLDALSDGRCPTAPGEPLDGHFYATHPIVWENSTLGSVTIYIANTNLSKRLLNIAPAILLLFVFMLLSALLLIRVNAHRATAGLEDLVGQLGQGDALEGQLRTSANAPGEVVRLAEVMNQRFDALQRARHQAETEAARRAAAEDAQARGRELLSNIINVVPYAIFAQRDDGTMLFANNAAAALYEVSLDAFMQPEFGGLRATLGQALGQVKDPLLGGDGSEDGIVVFGSNQRHLDVARVRFMDGQATLTVAIDRTEELQLQRQLEFSQRLEVVGTLAGGIAHDFNNLLTPILGYATLLAEQNLPADTLRQLSQIELAAIRARDVVQQMLALSRQQPVREELLQPAELLETVASLMRISAPATVQIAVNVAHAPNVLADRTQIEQVLLNLCTNAMQAIGDRTGRIDLVATTHRADESDEALQAGVYAMFKVIDTGPGIAPEVLPHVFEPFFTTKEIGQGSGLGLAVAHGIARTHGGMLSVCNAEAAGAEFTLLLPGAASA